MFTQSIGSLHTAFTKPCQNESNKAETKENQMQKKLKIGILATAGVLAISTGIGVAAAKTAANSSVQAGFYASNPHDIAYADETVSQWYCGGRSYMTGYLTPQVASLLGTTTTDLENQLKSGKTLADIAAGRGVTNDQLVETMMGPYAEHLTIMVKYSFLTQTQADELAQEARTRLQNVITSQFDSNDGFLGLGGMMRRWFGGNAPQTNGDATTDLDGDGDYGCGGYGPGGYGGMMGYGPGAAENGNGSYGYGGMMGYGTGNGNGAAGYGGMMGRW